MTEQKLTRRERKRREKRLKQYNQYKALPVEYGLALWTHNTQMGTKWFDPEVNISEYCPKCLDRINKTYCSECGRLPFRVRKFKLCDKCHRINSTINKYCEFCGSELEKAKYETNFTFGIKLKEMKE